jgi:hypothetical protein
LARIEQFANTIAFIAEEITKQGVSYEIHRKDKASGAITGVSLRSTPGYYLPTLRVA